MLVFGQEESRLSEAQEPKESKACFSSSGTVRSSAVGAGSSCSCEVGLLCCLLLSLKVRVRIFV